MMKMLFISSCSLLILTLCNAQNRNVKFDILTGIHKPLGSLNVENTYGWRLGAGLRYRLKNKSSLNMLQLNYDAFAKSYVRDNIDQKENGEVSNTLTLLTGYSYPIFNKLYIAGNAGIGFVGHNRTDRVTKFGVNPVISYEPFTEIYVDFGYLNFFGGYRNTNYLNFNLRYSF